jgi:hypothetical protein
VISSQVISTLPTSTSPFVVADELQCGDALQQFYNYPAGMVDVRLRSEERNVGFFRFGPATCFGACALPDLPGVISHAGAALPDAAASAVLDSDTISLPFDPGEVAHNLRFELYMRTFAREREKLLNSTWVRNGYYAARRFMPVAIRKHLQRLQLANWRRIPFPSWPADCSVELMFEQLLHLALQARDGAAIPFVWFWPRGHLGCLILTHDVEQAAGRDFCSRLMALDESAGFRSSFQIIPEDRYVISPEFLDEIRSRGHEVNLHDLNHDGHLFRERKEFLRRAERIRRYAQEFGAEGFRSGVLYRNLEWYDGLDFSYDMSIPNVARLDPQRGGCCTVMPYFIGRLLELPLTMTQDYTLFHILREYSLRLWEEQIDAVLARYGLLSFNVHPDYLTEERGLAVYLKLLSRLASVRAERNLWAALPGHVNRWWRQRSLMELVGNGKNWSVVGEGSELARVAYATMDGDRLVYTVESQ